MQKPLPVAVRTTARMSASSPQRASAFRYASRISGFMALRASGRLRTIHPTPSSTSNLSKSVTVGLLRSRQSGPALGSVVGFRESRPYETRPATRKTRAPSGRTGRLRHAERLGYTRRRGRGERNDAVDAAGSGGPRRGARMAGPRPWREGGRTATAGPRPVRASGPAPRAGGQTRAGHPPSRRARPVHRLSPPAAAPRDLVHHSRVRAPGGATRRRPAGRSRSARGGAPPGPGGARRARRRLCRHHPGQQAGDPARRRPHVRARSAAGRGESATAQLPLAGGRAPRGVSRPRAGRARRPAPSAAPCASTWARC